MWHYDAHFIQGGHPVCQDFANGVQTQHGVVVALADGCSDSKHSDIGARLLVSAYLRSISIWRKFHIDDIISRLQTTITLLGLPSSCLDATLLGSYQTKGCISCLLFGDGFIFFQYPDRWEIFTRKYPQNAPRYLSYELDNQRRARYIACIAQEVCTKKITLYPDFTLQNETEYTSEPFELISCSDPDLLGVFLFSDGLESFPKQTPFEVAKDVLAFKSRNGEFVQRRLIRLKKQYQETGTGPADDFSCAGLIKQ